MSISARQRDLEDALRRQSVDLQVIARRTEPLSPTRKHKVLCYFVQFGRPRDA